MSRLPRSPASNSYSRFEYCVGGSRQFLDGRLRERSAAEIGVQDHAGGVDDRPKRRRRIGFDRGDNALFQSSRGDRGFIHHLLRNNFAAHFRKDFANGGYGIAAFQ